MNNWLDPFIVGESLWLVGKEKIYRCILKEIKPPRFDARDRDKYALFKYDFEITYVIDLYDCDEGCTVLDGVLFRNINDAMYCLYGNVNKL